MALSIIIPWCNRPEIAVTLARNDDEFCAISAEILLVNCGGRPEGLRSLLPPMRSPVTIINVAADRFNKCRALNVGAAEARFDSLFLLDADMLLEQGVLRDATKSLTEKTFVTIARVRESQPQSDSEFPSGIVRASTYGELVFVDGRKVIYQRGRFYHEDCSRAGPGLMFVSKRNFLCVGGMNSTLEGWGFEDLDLHIRLKAVLSLKHFQVGAVTHLSHGDELRCISGKARWASAEANRSRCLHKYASLNFSGSFDEDCASTRFERSYVPPAPEV